MYNLTVDVAHTFFVGQWGWLVHNAGCKWGNPRSILTYRNTFKSHGQKVKLNQLIAHAIKAIKSGNIWMTIKQLEY